MNQKPQHFYMARDDKLLKKLGYRLRTIREAKNWTLEATEEHGWPNWQHINAIENGKKDISVSTLNKLAKMYKVSMSEILSDL